MAFVELIWIQLETVRGERRRIMNEESKNSHYFFFITK
jgi:hypothetical protein